MSPQLWPANTHVVEVGGSHATQGLGQDKPLDVAEDEVYDQSDATGFINLFGLSMKMRALLNIERTKQAEEPGPLAQDSERDQGR